MTEVYPNIYIGDPSSISDKYDVVVSVNGATMGAGAAPVDLTPPDEVSMSLSIKENELMESEVTRAIMRLNDITERIHALQKHQPTTLIVCPGGHEGAPLVAGYYMRRYGAMSAPAVIDKLEYLYMDATQRAADAAYKAKIAAIESGSNIEFTLDETQGNAARQELRCLTIGSYRALISGVHH